MPGCAHAMSSIGYFQKLDVIARYFGVEIDLDAMSSNTLQFYGSV